MKNSGYDNNLSYTDSKELEYLLEKLESYDCDHEFLNHGYAILNDCEPFEFTKAQAQEFIEYLQDYLEEKDL